MPTIFFGRSVTLVLAALCAGAGIPAAGGCGSSHQGTGGHDGGVASAGSGGPGSGGGDASSITQEGGTSDGGEGGTIGDSTGVAAVRVADFLGSIGVCVHITQGVDAPQPSATAMGYAGIKNLRDDGNPATVASWIAVYQQAGVRTNFLPVSDIAATVDMAKKLKAAGALLSIEGPNEPNNFPITYQGQTSNFMTTFTPVAHFQRDLYAAVRAEPTLDGVPVFHSSEAGGSQPDNVGLQFLTIPSGAGTSMPAGTKYADYANTHNYVCGHSSKLVDNVCWNAVDPTLNGDWDGMYVEYGHTWHGGFAGYSNADLIALPKVSTETGWVTSGSGAITEEQQARVFLNLYLAAYKRGWSYTFIYMLRDDPVQGYWGLFDTGYKPKTSGAYLHNLTTILADPGGAQAAGLFDYSIAAEPSTVHDLLMQKSDGTFALAVWDERPSGGTDAITVSLGKTRPVVKVYDPTAGTAPTQSLSNVDSVMLTLSDHPVILAIEI
jgi:hypothetical protein